jgi:hypothetical protein
MIANAVYLVTLHPYAKYPGPFLAKFTKLYGAYHAVKGDLHLDMWKCHLKYGTRPCLLPWVAGLIQPRPNSR